MPMVREGGGGEITIRYTFGANAHSSAGGHTNYLYLDHTYLQLTDTRRMKVKSWSHVSGGTPSYSVSAGVHTWDFAGGGDYSTGTTYRSERITIDVTFIVS